MHAEHMPCSIEAAQCCAFETAPVFEVVAFLPKTYRLVAGESPLARLTKIASEGGPGAAALGRISPVKSPVCPLAANRQAFLAIFLI